MSKLREVEDEELHQAEHIKLHKVEQYDLRQVENKLNVLNMKQILPY